LISPEKSASRSSSPQIRSTPSPKGGSKRAHVDLTANDSDFESPILRSRKASLTGTTSHESFFDSGTFEDDEDEEDVRDEEGKEKGKKQKFEGLIVIGKFAKFATQPMKQKTECE